MAKARWIPVTERLPKKVESVTVTVDVKGKRMVTTAYYDNNEGGWHYTANGMKANVVAWMALAPWEG